MRPSASRVSAAAWVLSTGVVAALSALPARAEPPQSGIGIYTCTDDRGRKLTSDRPIAECSDREQRVLNRDGSLKTVHPPTLTAEERAARDARERKAAELRAAQADAIRRDRNLLNRYPNEAAHRRARESALDTVRLAIKATEQRFKDLEAERKPLLDEAEFYKGRTLPPKLKALLDANDVAVEAQRAAASNQEAELVRVNQIYDVELARLQRLWGGATPGSLGPLPSARIQAQPKPRQGPS